MSTFVKIGELVLNLEELALLLRILPTMETKGHIEILLRNGRGFSIYEGSPSYDALAQWLRDTPEFSTKQIRRKQEQAP